MRSGNLKSRIAAPSRRNSGLEATTTSADGLASRISRSTSSPVPTGTVDLVTTTVKPDSAAAISRAAAVDVSQVGMAVAAPRRRADRDEHGVGFRDRRGQVGGEIQPLGLDVGRHQRIEPGLEDRDLASAQGFDLAGILVHAGDLVAEIGKAGAGYQPHIARANHGDSHETTRI